MSKLNYIVIAVAALLFFYFGSSAGRHSPDNKNSYLLDILRNSLLQDAPPIEEHQKFASNILDVKGESDVSDDAMPSHLNDYAKRRYLLITSRFCLSDEPCLRSRGRHRWLSCVCPRESKCQAMEIGSRCY